MSACPRCVARGPLKNSDPPKCAFVSGIFSGENWNCATANAIRYLVQGDGFGTVPAGVSASFSNDTTALLVPVDIGEYEFLLVSWYKRRGRTAVIATVGNEASPLELALAEEVITYLERTLLGVVPTLMDMRS